MNSLWESLERLKILFFEGLAKIEASTYYEQLLNKYEALSPEQQKYIRLSSRLSIILLIVYFLSSPLLTLFQNKNTLSAQRSLLAEMKIFNMSLETQPRPAPPPRDWQNLPANTSDEANNSLRSYITSIGFPEGSYQMLISSNGHIQLSVPEINLRQVQALVHQIDGWHPSLKSQILDIKVLEEDPQKLSLSMTIAHQSGLAPRTESAPAPRAQDTPERRAQPRNVVTPSPPPPSARFDDDFDDSPIRDERPTNPRLRDTPPADEYPDFEIDYGTEFDDNDFDSLPPPPPLDDEDF